MQGLQRHFRGSLSPEDVPGGRRSPFGELTGTKNFQDKRAFRPASQHIAGYTILCTGQCHCPKPGPREPEAGREEGAHQPPIFRKIPPYPINHDEKIVFFPIQPLRQRRRPPFPPVSDSLPGLDTRQGQPGPPHSDRVLGAKRITGHSMGQASFPAGGRPICSSTEA